MKSRTTQVGGRRGFSGEGLDVEIAIGERQKKVYLMHIRKKGIQSKIKASIRIFVVLFYSVKKYIFERTFFLEQRKTL